MFERWAGAFLVQADLPSPASCERVVDDTVDALGRLDVLVNMASKYVSKPVDELTLEDWNGQLAVDLTRDLAVRTRRDPAHAQAAGGRIINFGDWVARSGRPRYTGVPDVLRGESRVIALTEALALELAPDQILVNAIAPGPIVAPESVSDEEFAKVERATPLGRWGGETEVAKACSRSLTAISSPARPFASTADGI